MKKFNALSVSSKIGACGLPLRVDSYKTCSFGCMYCFSNNRVIRKINDEDLQVANVNQLKNKMDKVFNKNEYSEENLIDIMLRDNITWHYGGMSDPFQPCEKDLGITKQIVDIANEYNRSILFSTKSNTYYDAKVNPDLHAFQLSVTNLLEDNYIEPNLANIKERIKFFQQLKNEGFKVGIRIQPFIPGITTDEIIDVFKDADYFTIEGLKLVPQNKELNEYLLNLFNIPRENFTQKGLLNLKPEIREELYRDMILKLQKYNIPFSISDNDMRKYTCGKCCCGDCLIKKSTNFDVTNMLYTNGEYDKFDVLNALNEYKYGKVKGLFTSNRQKDVYTVEDLIYKNFDKKTNPISPKFQYKNSNK